MGVDGEVGGDDAACGAGLDLEDDQGRAVPGDEVDVSGEPLGAPAAGDDRVAEAAEVEESSVFAALAGEQMRGQRGPAVGDRAQPGVGAAFEGETVLAKGDQRSHRLPKAIAARKVFASPVVRSCRHKAKAVSAFATEFNTADCDR